MTSKLPRMAIHSMASIPLSYYHLITMLMPPFRSLITVTFSTPTVSENFLFVKNLTNEPWEFGYAVGASRPLVLKASSKRCSFCPQNFVAGVEMYGGLGDRYHFGFHETSQYLAPVPERGPHFGRAQSEAVAAFLLISPPRLATNLYH